MQIKGLLESNMDMSHFEGQYKAEDSSAVLFPKGVPVHAHATLGFSCKFKADSGKSSSVEGPTSGSNQLQHVSTAPLSSLFERVISS